MTKLALPTRKLVNFDGVSSTINYIGEAAFGTQPSDPFWRIYSLNYNGSDFNIRFANGDDSFSNIWNDRATYIYS